MGSEIGRALLGLVFERLAANRAWCKVMAPNFASSKLARRIGNFVDEKGLGTAACNDAGFISERDPDTVRGPDVSFVRTSRLQDPDEYFDGAPDLAVEIVSPGDDASDLREKIKQYLDAGTAVVWVVYPRSRQVEIHTPDKTIRRLGVEDILDASELLPGFQLSVRAILQ